MSEKEKQGICLFYRKGVRLWLLWRKGEEEENVAEPTPKITWEGDQKTEGSDLLGIDHCDLWDYFLLPPAGRLGDGL